MFPAVIFSIFRSAKDYFSTRLTSFSPFSAGLEDWGKLIKDRIILGGGESVHLKLDETKSGRVKQDIDEWHRSRRHQAHPGDLSQFVIQVSAAARLFHWA